MAKFKKVRRYAKKAFKSFKRYSKNENMSPVETAAYSAVYGGLLRQPVANMIPDVDMLGGYSDNAILGGIGYLAAWKGKGIIKKMGKTILMNEAFLVGAKLSSGLSTTAVKQSNNFVVTGY